METLAPQQKDHRRLWALLVTALGMFSIYFTGGSISIVLPKIATEFGVSTSEISFVTIFFSLVIGVLTLPFGRLGDKIGYRSVFLIGQGIFSVGALLSGLFGKTLITLLVFRCVMAVGAAMVQCITLAMLMSMYPEIRGKIMGIHSVIVSATGVISPLLGGLIADYLSWHLVFIFNLPLSLLTLVLGLKLLKKTEIKPTKSDPPGTVFLILFMTSLLLLLNSRTISIIPAVGKIILAVVCVISFILLIRVEKRSENPLLELSFFRIREFTIGNIVCLIGYLISAASNQSVPFYLQNIRGLSSSVSSLFTMIFPLMMVSLATVFGALSDRVGPRKILFIGLIVQLVGLGVYTSVGVNTPLWLVAAAKVVFGFGSGMFYAPITSMIMGSVPKTHSGLASGMVSTMRNIAAALGGTLFSLMIASQTEKYTSLGYDASYSYVYSQRDMMLVVLGLTAVGVILLGYLMISGRKKQKAAEAPIPEAAAE